PGLNPVAGSTTYVLGGGADAFTQGVNVGPFRSFLAGAGSAVALGDVNGDRRADLVTGAPYGSDGGTVYVFYGPVDEGQLTLDSADATFTGDAGSEAGAALAVGSLTKNRRPSLAVGAPSDAGRTYVILGR
ncbi:MAG TPA: FG-GAP repeat protein, partial [Vicinamibacterales bacterium]|nr:FG-GAP repeat protein [Vicinamibacterales bacterium]